MITEHDHEPIPGLPGLLPPGERILWQGKPVRAALARDAFHVRLIAGYFALLLAVALVSGGGWLGVGLTLAGGTAGMALLQLLAWAAARSSIYTLTNRRIVFRIGVALPKCINLPLTQISAIDLHERADGTGDLPLTVLGRQRLGYLALWPHARPWRLADPQPMLRGIADAATVAATIGRACAAVQDAKVVPLRPVAEPMLSVAAA